MIIYNITCKVEWPAHAAWLAWIKGTYIPAMLSGDIFYHGQLVKLIEMDETDGPTYALQFHTQSLDRYHHFLHDPAAAGLRSQYNLWNGHIVTFATLMELVK